MSHGDKVAAIPEGFETIAQTASCPHAAIYNAEKQFYGVQFHPEVTHTRQGMRLLTHFVMDICNCEKPSPSAHHAIVDSLDSVSMEWRLVVATKKTSRWKEKLDTRIGQIYS